MKYKVMFRENKQTVIAFETDSKDLAQMLEQGLKHHCDGEVTNCWMEGGEGFAVTGKRLVSC